MDVSSSYGRFPGGTFKNDGIVFRKVESGQLGREHFHCLSLFKYQRHNQQEPLGEYPKVLCIEGSTVYVDNIVGGYVGENPAKVEQVEFWVTAISDKFQHTLGRGADVLLKSLHQIKLFKYCHSL